MNKIFIFLSITFISGVLLNGCANEEMLSNPDVQTGAAVGAVSGAVIGGNIGDGSGSNIAAGAVLGALAGGAIGQASSNEPTQQTGGWQ